MHVSKATVAALTGALLFGVVTLTSAMPQKKAPKKAGAGAPSAAEIAAGKKVYDSQGCAACHVVKDKGGKTGPELTHIGSQRKAPQLELAVRDPKKREPKSTMPAYGPDKINAKELKSLVAYMLSLK